MIVKLNCRGIWTLEGFHMAEERAMMLLQVFKL